VLDWALKERDHFLCPLLNGRGHSFELAQKIRWKTSGSSKSETHRKMEIQGEKEIAKDSYHPDAAKESLKKP
jgi:hypothetical protein